jgi:tRNA-modifying protein YgfZ
MSDAVATPPMIEIAHQPVLLHHGDLAREYAALRDGALVVDRGYRSRTRFLGARAREMVTGLVTNDVAGLATGHGLYAAALTAKGKVVADVRIFAMPDSLLADTAPRAGPGWLDIVRKYVNPRVVPYRDESATLTDVGVFGPRAVHVTASALALPETTVGALAAYGHVDVAIDGATATLARVPDLGVDGFDVFCATDARDTVWARLTAAGATPGGLSAVEIARVEAGRPEWGIDIDDATLPQEANFDELGAISYTKGCYTGQETVARIHFRGHVNRHLRGLRLGGDDVPPDRTPLYDVEGQMLGDVRSIVRSPRFGPIALAMVRRDVPLGATVIVRWVARGGDETGEMAATVVALPFAPLTRP